MILSTLIAVMAVSSIGAALAALVVIAEYFFANYGECKITINDEREVVTQGGGNVLNALTNEKIFIPSACGGRGTCGLCKIKVLEGAGTVLPTEEPYLDKEEIESNVRLSCQVKIRNDLKIKIPEEIFSIREYRCRTTDITDLTEDIKLFRFQLIEPTDIDYKPGQYIQFLAPAYEGNDEEVYRAYSIASDPNEKNVIELIIRLVPDGICTTYCFKYLKVDDEVLINGPYGEFMLSETEAPIVFIAGGSGMAPIRNILYQMKNEDCKRKAVYYFGASYADQLFMLDEMKMFEEQLADFKFIPTLSRPKETDNWKGQTGLVTEAVQRDLKNAPECEAYLCGSPGMIDASVKVLLDLGMSEKNIFYDKFE